MKRLWKIADALDTSSEPNNKANGSLGVGTCRRALKRSAKNGDAKKRPPIANSTAAKRVSSSHGFRQTQAASSFRDRELRGEQEDVRHMFAALCGRGLHDRLLWRELAPTGLELRLGHLLTRIGMATARARLREICLARPRGGQQCRGPSQSAMPN